MLCVFTSYGGGNQGLFQSSAAYISGTKIANQNPRPLLVFSFMRRTNKIWFQRDSTTITRFRFRKIDLYKKF